MYVYFYSHSFFFFFFLFTANLFNFLEKFNIKVDEQHRFYGSNLRKLITDVFVEQLYLKKEKKDNDEYVSI